jgi:dUTP pyrophosphatase
MVMKVKIVNNSNNKLPAYSTENSAGMDIHAFLGKPVILKPFQRKMFLSN